MVIAVTVHGSLDGLQPVVRSGAQPGDLVAVCGSLGKAACGLALLESGNDDLIRSYDDWVSAQLAPKPPIDQAVVANQAGATAMLDVSDGLATDLNRICQASNVTIEIFSKDLLGFEAMLELPAQSLGLDPKQWVLSGGEDHALLATFPAAAQIPKSFKVIGKVLTQGAPALLLDGKAIETAGWDSIRGS
jgi:thiamine-monophosphate kinase